MLLLSCFICWGLRTDAGVGRCSSLSPWDLSPLACHGGCFSCQICWLLSSAPGLLLLPEEVEMGSSPAFGTVVPQNHRKGHTNDLLLPPSLALPFYRWRDWSPWRGRSLAKWWAGGKTDPETRFPDPQSGLAMRKFCAWFTLPITCPTDDPLRSSLSQGRSFCIWTGSAVDWKSIYP